MAESANPDQWDVLHSAWQSGETIWATVISADAHRLFVDVGVRALLPLKLLDAKPTTAPEQYLGQRLPVKIVELHQPTGNVVVSHRAALEST